MQVKEPAESQGLPAVTKPKSNDALQRRRLVASTVVLGTLALLLFAPGTLLDKLFFISSGICSQRPAHSHFFDGQQLPLETRMVGIFSAFLLTLVFLWFIGRGRTLRLPPRSLTITLICLILPVALDGLNATLYDLGWFHLYEPQLFLRLLTGTLSGIGFAVLIQPMFNLLVWGLAHPGGPLRRWRELGAVLLIGVALIAVVMSGWGIFFWPLAFLAVGGVFTMMVILNLMIFMVISGRQNWARRPADLLTPVALTFLFTLAEMSLFAVIRISLIGAPI